MMRADLVIKPLTCVRLYKNRLGSCVRLYSTASQYLEKAVYPPIEDINVDPKKQEKLQWHQKIARLETYEQKLMELNMPKYYGFWSCILNDTEYQPNALPFLKFVTRTEIVEGLPEHYYSDVSSAASVFVDELAPHVENLISMHFHNKISRFEDSPDGKKCQEDFLHGLHRLLSTCIQTNFTCSPHPRITGWWLAGGLQNWGRDRPEWMHFKEEVRDRKLFSRNLFEDWEEPFMGDFCLRGGSSASLGYRGAEGLPQVEARAEAQETVPAIAEESSEDNKLPTKDNKLPMNHSYFDKDPSLQDDSCIPRCTATNSTTKEPVSFQFAGFWSGEKHCHWRLFYHLRKDMDQAIASFTPHDLGQDPIHQKLIIAGHTQGLAQAAMLGFTPVTELTYPLVHQNVLTDGRRFNLSLHQLNTIALHGENTVTNPNTNKIWISPQLSLWDTIDSSGRVQGLNKELLTVLASLYSKQGLQRENATPYLSDFKYLWDFPAPHQYKEIFRNNIHYKLRESEPYYKKPEIYLWEKMYKLDFPTRPMDAKKKFYEGHVRKKLPSDRTGQDFNPKDLRTGPRVLKKKRKHLLRGFPPKIDSEKLCVEEYKWYKNYYWFR